MSFFDKLLGKDKEMPTALHEIRDNLTLLAEAERDIGNFYNLCAAARAEEKDFWEGLAEEEFRHAEFIQTMSALIAKEPGAFRPGYAFNAAEIRLFTFGIQTLLAKMSDGGIPAEKLLDVAREIEDSAIELQVANIVETKDAEFNRIARQIDSESRAHRSKIASKTAEDSGRVKKKKET